MSTHGRAILGRSPKVVKRLIRSVNDIHTNHTSVVSSNCHLLYVYWWSMWCKLIVAFLRSLLASASRSLTSYPQPLSKLIRAVSEGASKVAAADAATKEANNRAAQAEAALASYADSARQSADSAQKWSAAATEAQQRCQAAEARAQELTQLLNKAQADVAVAQHSAAGDMSAEGKRMAAAVRAAQEKELSAEQRAASLAQRYRKLSQKLKPLTAHFSKYGGQ
eukprot:scaffold67646_cov33-Prasinocladus_malaysianus.AAC.1